MQIKTTMRFHHTPTGMVTINNTYHIKFKFWRGCRAAGTLVHFFISSCKMVSQSSSAAQSCFDSWRPHGLQHARLPCPSPTPGACLNSCPSSRWRHPTISSSVVPFFSCLKSFPASGSFPMSHFFASGGQNIRASALASASVLPKSFHGWFPLGLTGLISGQLKGLSRVFSNTTVQKHQFFGAQLSL